MTARRVLCAPRRGAIIVRHDQASPTLVARALPRFRRGLQAEAPRRFDRWRRREARRAAPRESGAAKAPPAAKPRGNRRKYVRDYLLWLHPHRYAVGAVFVLALIAGALQMVEPLFMRFIVDRVLLNKALDAAGTAVAPATRRRDLPRRRSSSPIRSARSRTIVSVCSTSSVMLSLRRALFRAVVAPAAPEAVGHEDGRHPVASHAATSTRRPALLQMAIVSPAVSFIRLILAVAVLVSLNWRLALTALAIIPGVVLMSLTFSRRVRPIYRSLRKDAETIDGRVGETFSGIRVVRAFRAETRELLDYLRGRHTVLRKGALRASPRAGALDVLVPAAQRRERRDRLVRRLSEHSRARVHRRHHGVSVVHVSAAQPRLVDRQLVLRAAAIARGDGARVRAARHGSRQARPA